MKRLAGFIALLTLTCPFGHLPSEPRMPSPDRCLPLVSPALACLVLATLISLAACKQQAAQPLAAAPAAAPSPSTAPTLASAADKLDTPPDTMGEIKAVMANFLAAKSYHATMTHRGGPQPMTSEIDFVAPDRYRMTTPAGTQYVIGDTMIMNVEGRSMRLPMPKGTLNFRDPAKLAENEATLVIEALGNESLHGHAAKKYRMRNTGSPPTESILWVGADGYPLQIQVRGTAQQTAFTSTIRYSRFNDPTLEIDPPR